MKREYAHEPPIVSVTQLNPEQCEVLLHENINAETRTTTGANGEEQTTVYTAQEYTLIIPWREGIEDSIKANVSAWTEMARKQELEELLPKKLDELDNEPETHQAVAYYAAAQMASHDNAFLYASLYNKYEDKLEKMSGGVWCEYGGVEDAYSGGMTGCE